jgi:tungstate transport system ATP-binding protein
MIMLEAEGLHLQRDGRTILEVSRLQVPQGQVLAIIGPNGSGKSSLLLSLALLVPATFGRLSFDGRPVRLPADTLTIRRQIALVFQESLLLDTSVLDNAASGLLLRGTPRKEARARAQEWLERLGVDGLQSRRARDLSGGEAQRVSLARALALTPRLLLLDEPFAALDVLSRSLLLKELPALLLEANTTAILVTHDVAEIGQLAQGVAVLEGGRLVQQGTVREVFANPGSATVQRMADVAADMTAALQPFTQV